MFELPESWTSYVVRDPAGNSWKSGTSNRFADFSGIPKGRYSLTSAQGNARYHLILSSDIPGGALIALQGSASMVYFRFGNSGETGAYLVSLQSPDGVLQKSFYVYSPEVTLSFPPGDWQVVIAKPGESGFRFSVQADDAGRMERLNRVALLDKADWFVESSSFASVTSPFNYNTGPVSFNFTDAANPQHVIQVRDKQSGTISTYFTDRNTLEISLDPGKFEWRVLGIAQESIAYPELFSGLNAISGGWMGFTQRRVGERPPTSLSVPSGWTSYIINDPFGKIAGSAIAENWIDFSDLLPGRYSVIGNVSGNAVMRQEVVVSGDIEGGVAILRNLDGGGFEIQFGDPGSSDPFYVTVKSASGKDVSASYYYGKSIGLNLTDGSYFVTVARPSEKGFSFNISLADRKVDAVNNVKTKDSADWYLPSLDQADLFGPITTNSGLAQFSFDAASGDLFVIQLRDPYTGNIGTYFSTKEELAVRIDGGIFEWRAFGLPAQARDDEQLVSKITAAAGGWTRFTQLAGPPPVDYIMGLEPDLIKNAEQLILNYPTDAIRLSDGSIVVSNTYAATIERIFTDGRVERLAGGNREGYVASGVGREVLLRGPTQFFDKGDGTVLFVDSRNFVIREINLSSGIVRTVLGSNTLTDPVIENGQIKGLGDIYDIGRDADGNLYITAAKTILVGDQLYSDETKVLRQRPNGDWYFWSYDSSTLAQTSYKFVDMLFHDGVVSALVLNGSEKRYVQYTPNGDLIANIAIGGNFGGGLVRDPISGDLIIGNHTAMVRLNHHTLQTTPFPFNEPLANVSFMSLSGNRLIITDSDRGRVYEYDLEQRSIVGKYGQSSLISNVVIDLDASNGSLFMLDNQTPRVLRYDDGKIGVVAGTGIQSQLQAGANAKDTSFYFPGALTTAPDGSIYVVESNHRIAKIRPDRSVEIFAGSLEAGYSGDGETALNAKFQSIYGLEVAADGSLLVADSFNNAIRKISPNGTVTTLAGNGQAGMAWTTGPSIAALNAPNRVLVTATGRTFISDSWNNRVVELMADGRLLPFAGIGKYTSYQGSGDFYGDGGIATQAGLNTPIGIAFYEADGTMFIADSFNNRIRYVDSAGNVHTLIGSDRGYAFGTLLNLPNDVELVGDDLYIADSGNALVLKLADVDRTGNDLSNSLDVGKAISRTAISSRSENVSFDDLDFYNLTGYASGLVTVIASQDGLTVDFSNGSHSYYGKQVLLAGQSLVIKADESAFFIVSSTEKQKYTLTFSRSAQSLNTAMFTREQDHQVVRADGMADQVASMIHAMGAFRADSGNLQVRQQSHAQSYEYFA